MQLSPSQPNPTSVIEGESRQGKVQDERPFHPQGTGEEERLVQESNGKTTETLGGAKSSVPLKKGNAAAAPADLKL